jgi:hypothetical protein
MKALFRTILTLSPMAYMMGPIAADPAPQPQVIFTQGLQGTCAADWQGVEGRIYFMQWSVDLETWQFTPFLDFGDGMHSRGMESSTDKFFVRLFTRDDPAITSLEEAMDADFDGDGLSNIFELTFGYDPYNKASTADGNDNALDPDGDGLTNATEHTRSLNPMRKDNPKVLLQVTVE